MRPADTLLRFCAGIVLGLGCTPAGIRTAEPVVAGDASTTGGGGSDGGNGEVTGTGPNGAICGIKTFGLRMVPPDMLIVLDKSGSMNQLPDGTSCFGEAGGMISCGAMGKWSQMTAAINQVVKSTEGSIRWGLHTFPDDNDGCGVTAAPVVPIDNMNAALIAAAMVGDPDRGGRTPTRTGLVNAGSFLINYPDTNPKFILLATDGLPNCAPAGASAGSSDAEGSIQAVKNLVTMGIQVFVIGIGSVTEAQTTLTAMAIAGGQPQTADPRYYPVSSTADLVTVLSNIGSLVGKCSFSLGNQPPDPTNIAVSADGMRIPKDTSHMNGWDYGTGQRSIQLYGQWCEDARSGKLKDVKAIFGCPGVVIP